MRTMNDPCRGNHDGDHDGHELEAIALPSSPDGAGPVQGPRWRVGRRVPRNLYRGDEPIAMLATPELAAEMVALLNKADKFGEAASILRVLVNALRGLDGLGDGLATEPEYAAAVAFLDKLKSARAGER
jgi:hypothetical protein